MHFFGHQRIVKAAYSFNAQIAAGRFTLRLRHGVYCFDQNNECSHCEV